MAINGKGPRITPRLVPDVSIVLDRERHLRFDMQACWDAEKLYSAQQSDGRVYAVSDMLIGGTVGGTVCLLWAGLRHEDPELTLQEAMSLLRPGDMRRVTTLINQAVLDQTSPPDDEQKPEEEPQKKTEELEISPTSGGDSGPSAG